MSAPSTVERRWNAEGRLPRVLQRPWWVHDPDVHPRQNTDPWVFGERMLYSNCRQLGPRPDRRPSAMQRLPRGSVICFGSTIDNAFCVDTVFVVASAEPYRPSASDDLDVDPAFRTCVLDTFAAHRQRCAPCDAGAGHPSACDVHATGGAGDTDGVRKVAERRLTLYRGATVEDPVDARRA